MKKKYLLISLLFLLSLQQSFSQFSQLKYQIINKISLKGDGGWDYLCVDDSASRLYVSHGSMVQVVDVISNKLIDTIGDTKGVHGIAFAREFNKGFISNGKDTSISVFNLKTLQLITKIKITGINPDAILYDSYSQRVFVFNGRSSNATVIDAKSDKIIGTIALFGKPEFSVSDLKGKIFVNIEDKSEICVINANSLKVEHNWPIAPGKEPSGLAIDIKSHRLFSVCDNKLMLVVNSDNGKVICSVSIGENVDGVAFDPILKRIYSSNGEGTLTIIQEVSPDLYKVLETLKTQKGARTIALNSKTHCIYLTTAEYGETPKSTEELPHPRPSILPNTFTILEISQNTK